MIKKFILKNPFQLFLTILLPFLLSTILVIFVQSSFQGRIFEKLALEMVYNQQETDLQNTSKNVSLMGKSVNSIATTAFFDDTIKDLLYSDVNSEDYIKYERKLEFYKNIYPFLQSIYIYNGHNIQAVPSESFVYDRNSFADKGIFPILDDIQHNKTHSIVLRKIPNVLADIVSNQEKFINVYSYLFFDSQLQSGKVSEAIILNISEEWLKQSISSSDQKKNRIFVIDRNGILLSSDSIHPLLSDLKENNYIEQINSSVERNGNFRMNVDGVDSFVTYAATDVFDWRLISITPYADIVQDIVKMKQKTYFLVFCFIIGSILLSLYFSRKLYLPIKLVIQNYNVFEKNDFYHRKQDFLRKLVDLDDPISMDTFQEQFIKYNISLKPADSFLAILIKIDYFSEFCSKFNLTDRGLLKYGIIEIVSKKLSSGFYEHECIDIEEDQVLVLLSYSAVDIPSKNEELISQFKEIQDNIHESLDISISITFSEAFETLSELNLQYLKTLDLSFYRLIFGHKSLIFNENLNILADDFKYPQDQDKIMTDALIQGQLGDATKALTNIIQHASRHSFTILNSVLIRLLLSIRHAIEVLEANHSINVNFNLNIYLAKVQKIETLEKIQADFLELFENLSIGLEAKKDNKYIKLLEDVTRIIEQEFANPALSLVTIAEKVNLSPAYIGKLFKKHRLLSMTDYINNIRLSAAKDLIATTDEAINVIMERCGFLSRSHFFTLFKKVYGVTPIQHRNNSKIKPPSP